MTSLAQKHDQEERIVRVPHRASATVPCIELVRARRALLAPRSALRTEHWHMQNGPLA